MRQSTQVVLVIFAQTQDMKPTLLILAAGMGSRYGGLKQMDGIGPNGETIMDYSIYDAIQAGFGKVVFVIQEHFAEEFKQQLVSRLEGKIETELVFQNTNDLPDGFSIPKERVKAWGTGHAVWSARNTITEPFAVVNADDFYGRSAYQMIADFFTKENNDLAMVAYPLRQTLSSEGGVSRGICSVDKEGYLQKVVEHTDIVLRNEKVLSLTAQQELNPESLVSMNAWALRPSIFKNLEEDFVNFLEAHLQSEKTEFFLPSVLSKSIEDGFNKLKVIQSKDDWFGVTYKEDKANAQSQLIAYIQQGKYPQKLW